MNRRFIPSITDSLHRRPHDYLPEWTAWPGILDDPGSASFLSVVSADEGRVATFDEGTKKIFIVDETGQTIRDWKIDEGGNSVPVDIALYKNRVYLADRGQNRILVRDLDGDAVHEFSTHDGPISIAAGPDGDVYVLGRGNWGYRYTPSGKLISSWPMPDRSLWVMDIAVDKDHRAYASYLEYEEIEDLPVNSFASNQFDIIKSGVWVFEGQPYIESPPDPPAPQACTAVTDKWAVPPRIPLGDTVDVTLTVEGRCPGKHDPAEVLIVFDTSRSMGFDDGIDRAKSAVADVLSNLDTRSSRVGLITFDDGATLVQPLTSDIDGVRQLVQGLTALGDTRSTAGITVAHNELEDNGRPGVRKIILLVTDGAFKDEPRSDAEAARDAGMDIFALITPTREYRATDRDRLLEMVGGDAEHLFFDPDPREIVEAAHSFTNYTEEEGLFETITIDDIVPTNMSYIADSAVPPANFDAASNSLSWTLSDIMAADKIALTYKLRPQEVGIWPTNVRADADYRDVLGNDGELLFPVPEVEVYAPPRTFIYLPFLIREKCFPSDKPLDIALIIDASSSMLEPAAGDVGNKLDAARFAASAFISELRLTDIRDNASVVWFNSDSGVASHLTTDRDQLEAGLASIVPQEGTRIDKGLSEASGVFAASQRRGQAKPVVILLTDGIHNSSPRGERDVRDAAQDLKAQGSLIYTIGLGSNIQDDLLTEVASQPSGFYRSPSTDDLAAIYKEISERIPCDL